MIGRLVNKRAVLITLVCILSVFSIALFITINVSPLLIVYPKSLAISRAGINADYGRLLTYLELPGTKHLELAHLSLTAAAQSHFADVKRYLLLNELVMVVSTAATLLALRKEKRRQQLWQLLTPLEGVLSMLAILLTMALVDFPSLFIRSHYWLFVNLNWVLDPRTNPIILLMPMSFFTKLFIVWAGLVFLFLIILWGYLRFTTRFTKL